MANTTIHTAETWDKLYESFDQVNFSSFDYDTIKESLIQYMKTYYPEDFNDFIETSELIQMIEVFAYVAEQLSYRIDMSVNEMNISKAQRKKSILALIKFISYKPTRHYPASGLVKIKTVTTSQRLIDSQGNNIQNRQITWNDPKNPLWKEHFNMIMNEVMTTQFGKPSKVFNVNDVEMELYTLANDSTSFRNSVFPFTANLGNDSTAMEVVSVDIDSDGPKETYVEGNSNMNVLFLRDGLGDASDLTGFMLMVKQGSLVKNELSFSSPIPNRSYDLDLENVNEVDVWLNQIDDLGNVTRWESVDTINANNVIFNDNDNMNKFEIETLEDDKIRILFGDGNYGTIPVGNFELWTRKSDVTNSLVIAKSRITNQPMSFSYDVSDGNETCNMSFSLVSSLQNGAPSETLDHIKRNASSAYYSQNRLVNGTDYNSLFRVKSNILKLRSVNRTFAGHSRHVDFSDTTGNYQNLKIFGDDLRLYFDEQMSDITTTLSSRNLIDEVIEEIISTPGVLNMIAYGNTLGSYDYIRPIPRFYFIEDARLLEKTQIQAVIDRHYYGEPTSFIDISGVTHAEVSNDVDYRIYDANIPMAVNGVPLNPGPGGTGQSSQLQSVSDQPLFGLRFNSFINIVGDGTIITNGILREDVTFQCISIDNSIATFAVIGANSGNLGTVSTLQPETISNVQITVTNGTTEFVEGDAFVITYDDQNDSNSVEKYNLYGQWEIVDGTDIDETGEYDPTTAGTANDSSWVIKVTRNEDVVGNVISWDILYRDLKTVIQSPTTKFFYNSSDVIIDSDTGSRVNDRIEILRSNLSKDGTVAIGSNLQFDVVAAVRFANSNINTSALEVYSSNILTSSNDEEFSGNAYQFDNFVNVDTNIDYVYFVVNGNDLIPIEKSDTVVNDFTGSNLVSDSGQYERRIGRENLDFLWKHYSPNTNLIDMSTTNINDTYVIIRGYYESVRAYLDGELATRPTAPTPLELRNTFKDVINLKMMSDTVVMHSGEFRYLFGRNADSLDRGTFKVIKSRTTSLTDDQIKVKVLNIINDYFDISKWDFGAKIYTTDLISYIHAQMGQDISSVVLVPTYVESTFGAMLIIECGDNEVPISAATVDDIVIVDSYTPSVIRQS